MSTTLSGITVTVYLTPKIRHIQPHVNHSQRMPTPTYADTEYRVPGASRKPCAKPHRWTGTRNSVSPVIAWPAFPGL